MDQTDKTDPMEQTRRGFILGGAVAMVGAAIPSRWLRAALHPPLLYPPMDLSYFNKLIAPDMSGAEPGPSATWQMRPGAPQEESV